MLGVSHFFPLKLVYANRRSMLVPPTHWAPHGIPSKAADQSPGSFFVGANFGPKCIWLQRARAPLFSMAAGALFFFGSLAKTVLAPRPAPGGGAGAELTYLFGVWKLCTVCFGVAADAHMPKPTRIQMVVATWRGNCWRKMHFQYAGHMRGHMRGNMRGSMRGSMRGNRSSLKQKKT
jgi:hypothetical protein